MREDRHDQTGAFAGLSADCRRRLKRAIAINAVMFVVEFGRHGDANVRSVWLCSRNDAIGNVAVMTAALGVWGTATGWPDLAVAAVMAGLFLAASLQIVRQSLREIRLGEPATPSGAP